MNKHRHDNRRLEPSLLKAIALAVTENPDQSNNSIGLMLCTAPSTIGRIKDKIKELKFTREQIAAAPPVELAEFFYNEHTDRREKRQGVYYPDFVEEARNAVEGDISNAEAYRRYRGVCGCNNMEPLSPATYYRQIIKERGKFEITDPDFYIVRHFKYGVELQIDHAGMRLHLNTPAGQVHP